MIRVREVRLPRPQVTDPRECIAQAKVVGKAQVVRTRNIRSFEQEGLTIAVQRNSPVLKSSSKLWDINIHSVSGHEILAVAITTWHFLTFMHVNIS